MTVRLKGDLRPWTLVASQEIVQTKRGTIRKELWRSPDGTQEWEFPIQLYVGNYVCIFPITKEGYIVVTREWMQGAQVVCPQVPGGAVDRDSDLMAAVRELFEETGYRAGRIEIIPTVLYYFDRRSPASYKIALALDCEYVGRVEGGEATGIEVLEVTPGELATMLDAGEIHEPGVFVAVYYAQRLGYLMM